MSERRAIRNARSGTVVLGRAVWCASFFCRFRGLMFRRSLPPGEGLLFVFGWEPVILVVPGSLKKPTGAHSLQSLVPQAMPADNSAVALLGSLFREPPPLGAALLPLAVMLVAFLWLATRAVDRREYVLEQ